jgi:CheY-like chemotaxis protein
MSLAGNLEDLGLGEIMQLISLSRKTGVLSLTDDGCEGAIVFRQGKVVRASSSAYLLNLGDELVRKGAVDAETLDKALALQKAGGCCELLGVILIKHFKVDQETIEEVVREQIEQVVLSLFSWIKGSFRFKVQGNIDTVDGGMVDPLQFMLSQGLNPQFLAMEGTRLFDENRYAAELAGSRNAGEEHDDVDIAFDLVDGVAPTEGVRPAAGQPLVIVDDDEPTLKAMAGQLNDSGYVVHAMTRSEDALIKVDSLYRGGERPIVLVDLVMPRMDGSGVFGGIELLELLHNNFKDISMLVMTDQHHDEAEKKVCDMGYRCIMKPHSNEFGSPETLQSFFSLLKEELKRFA